MLQTIQRKNTAFSVDFVSDSRRDSFLKADSIEEFIICQELK